MLLTVLVCYCLFMSLSYLRRVSTEMAVSDAIDIVTLSINSSVNQRMKTDDMSYDRFVSLDKDKNGVVTAIKTNMTEINALSSDILSDVVGQGERRVLEVDVPLGNLLGSSLLMGKGPNVPLDIIMLTSSRIDFRNDLASAGINQTKHRIIFELTVEIDVLIPWDMASAVVKSDVLIAETVIVGNVPETYISME
ncbi:MAG: sporulation protein YunB [Candidatus Heteroscillospira sp.]